MNEHREEAQKLISQIEEFHPSLRVAKPSDGECTWPVRRTVALFSLPAAEVIVCRDPAVIAAQALISPIFLGLLFLLSTIVIIGIRREHREQLLRVAAETKAEAEARIVKLSRQVAHDIRGPLSALQTLGSHAQSMAPMERDLLLQASTRIHSIAEDLLSRSRPSGTHVGLCRVDDVIEAMKLELLLRAPGVPISFSLQADATVGIPGIALQRMISNLVQNAFEASKPGQNILIASRRQGDVVSVTIADEGRGIPESLLQKLGTIEISHGKDDGNGLGLLDARKTLDHVGGKLQIRSREGLGTQVELSLPRISEAEGYSSTTNPSSSSSVF